MTLNSKDIITLLVSQLGIQNFEFKLIRHRAVINWRQQHADFYSKLKNISSAILFTDPSAIPLLGHDLIRNNIDNLTTPSEPLISVASLVISPEGKHFHLPMMNLHLDYPIGLDKLRKTLNEFIGSQYYLLKSDRFYHVYGQSLMDNRQWELWNLKFLMLDSLVSPRYIGYSLEQKYNTLRINATNYIKTVVPFLVTDEDTELEDLKVFAIAKHGPQRRKNGEPYFYHLFEVEMLSSEIASVLNIDEKEMRVIQEASLFHDLIEDTDTAYEDIVKTSGCQVAEMVALLSADKRKSKQIRDELFLNAIKNAPLSVQIIKLADIYSNLSSIYQAFLRKNPVDQAFISKADRFLGVLNSVLRSTRPFKVCQSMILEMTCEGTLAQILPQRRSS